MRKILIVGQGLAGSLLAYTLKHKFNQQVVIADVSGNFEKASTVASGIINPITGRRIVKSWMVDKLHPYAFDFYQNLEKQLSSQLLNKIDVLRFWENIQEYNDFTIKCNEPNYQDYLKTTLPCKEIEFVNHEFGYGVITQSATINTQNLIHGIKQWLKSSSLLIEQKIDYKQFTIENEKVKWQNTLFDCVIFCEGFQVINNLYFSNLPFTPTKGEVLICKIPNLKTKFLLKKGVFIVPLHDDIYWIGSSTTRDDFTPDKTDNGINWLEKKLSKFIKIPYQINETKMAIRPTTIDRRPIIGQHPEIKQFYIFNGMGTKGYSLVPYFSNHFAEHIVNQQPLMKEVNLNRFLAKG